MSFQWKHFFNVADALTSSNNPAAPSSDDLREAFLRTAIGRFYYSAFGEAYLYVASNVEQPPQEVERSSKKHQWVVEQLESHSDPTIRSAGQRLKTLRRYRNQADYEARIQRSTPERMAEFSKEYASRILQTLAGK